MTDKSSDSLMQYLNGEISVFEWLEIGEDEKSNESKEASMKLVDGDEDGDGDDDDDDGDDDDEEEVLENEGQGEGNTADTELIPLIPLSSTSQELTEPIQEMSITDSPTQNVTVQAPRRMTDLLLGLPAAKKAQKLGGTSVDEFRADIPISRKRRQGRPRRNEVPPKFRRRMGEANIFCAKGEYDKAKEICIEIIRQVPKCPEPFQTLGMLYEMQGEMEKALQFLLITAYLSKTGDVEEWLKLAGMSLEQNNYKQAMACYNQALKQDPNNVSILWDKAALCYQMNDIKKAVEGYEATLKVLPTDCPEKYFDLTIEIAMIHHENSSLDKAIEAMSVAFEKYPGYSDFRAINLLAELYISGKHYSFALKTICTLCHITQQTYPCDDPSSNIKEPLSSFSNLMGYDIESSPQKGRENKSDSISPASPIRTIPDLNFDNKWFIPEEVPIDLRVKAVVCLIHLRCLRPVKDLMSALFLENIEDVGDLFLDIAEAYAETGEHTNALPILDALIETSKYNQAGVWLKKAQCLMSLGRLEQSIMAYNQVVNLAPNHLEARLTLSSLHQQLGRPDQALDILTDKTAEQGYTGQILQANSSQDVTSDEAMETDQEQPKEPPQPRDYSLLFHKCALLESQNRPMDFVDAGLQLFSMYFNDVYHMCPDKDEKCLGLKLRKRNAGKKTTDTESIDSETPKPKKTKNKKESEESVPASRAKDDTGFRVEEWWDMLKKVIFQASAIKRHKEAEHLILCGLNSRRLTPYKEYQQELEFMSVFASFILGRYPLAFDYLRTFLSTLPEKTVLWNMLALIVCKTEDIRHHRFCMRLMAKQPDNLALNIMNGHNAFVAGNYKYAITEYVRAFRRKPDDPLISLCLGIQFIHLACQKFPRKRHITVLQGIIFLFQYLTLRGECQEAYYNIGRGFHQLGLTHFAVHYYQKALEFPYHLASEETNGDAQISQKHDLHREAAYNLSLLYRASGNDVLARKILCQYIII